MSDKSGFNKMVRKKSKNFYPFDKSWAFVEFCGEFSKSNENAENQIGQN